MSSTPDILDTYTDYIDPDIELEDEFDWTPACWDDCEMCGCHGLCDGEPWDEDIDYEEEDE